MLTRLEVDGFKNLLGFRAEFGPLTCIAGPNGVGKSNIFDAIRFLSLLASNSLMDAARMVRGGEGRSGDPRELFWTDGERYAEMIRFGVEMVVPRHVHDDFGREAEATITFLRYDLELGYEPPTAMATLGRLILQREELRHIKLSDAPRHLRFPHSAKEFRGEILHGRRAGQAFISTVDKIEVDEKSGEELRRRVVQVHQDGGSRGPARPSPATQAPGTIISTGTQSSDPTILAARREFQSWRLLALEPAALRQPDHFTDAAAIGTDGAHLARTLYRLAHTPAPGSSVISPDRVFQTLASEVSDIVPIRAIRVDRNDRQELLTLEVQQINGPFLPARALSDGTLRFLALCIMEADPEVRGLLCMEEPENGIHPARLEAMVALLQRLAVDPHMPPGPDNPLRQVVLNTHSPGVVHLFHQRAPEALLFAQDARVRGPSGRETDTLRLRPLENTWRCDHENPGVSRGHILNYLNAVTGTQLTLDSQ